MKVIKLSSLLLLFVLCVSMMVGCKTHSCDYCGAKAIWQATETFLDKPIGSDPYTYVCADCKRIGRGPIPFTGNTIKWKKIG